MDKSDYKKLGLPAVRVVDVKGYEFAKVGTIAKWLDVSADVVRDLLLRLGQGHEIRVPRGITGAVRLRRVSCRMVLSR